jgi:hypothetical protein
VTATTISVQHFIGEHRKETKVRRIKPGLVAYTYNLSYLGGRDQEYHRLRPSQGKNLLDPILKAGMVECKASA